MNCNTCFHQNVCKDIFAEECKDYAMAFEFIGKDKQYIHNQADKHIKLDSNYEKPLYRLTIIARLQN